jgi:hypothetical protein
MRDTGSSAYVKPRTAALVVLCLAAGWYNAARFSSAGRVGLKQGVPADMYPLWNGTDAILHGLNPYSVKVTEQNDFGVYGTTAKAAGDKKGQQFAYPVYAALPVMPLELVNFRVANQIAFWLFIALVPLSVGWLRERWDWTTVVIGALSLATYPVIFAIQSRQPTIVFFGLAVGSFALLCSGQTIPAGMLAALSTGKPHIALPVLLPMLIWTSVRWKQQKRFVISLALSLMGLLALSSAATPGWREEWIAALRHYAQYGRGPLVILFFGNKIGAAILVLLLLILIVGLWRRRESDLLFQVALSVAIFQLVIPYEPYNAIMLLIPAVWVADNAHVISKSGASNQVALAAMRVALVGSWVIGALGALLWHTSAAGRSIAWALPGVMVPPLFVCMATMMLVQLFFPAEDLDQQRLIEAE